MKGFNTRRFEVSFSNFILFIRKMQGASEKRVSGDQEVPHLQTDRLVRNYVLTNSH